MTRAITDPALQAGPDFFSFLPSIKKEIFMSDEQPGMEIRKGPTRGRPQKQYDPDLGEKIREMVGNGLRQEDISAVAGMSVKTLRKIYKHDLKIGSAIANASVAKRLFERCQNGDVAAQIFWLKARAGWNEKGSFLGGEILTRYRNGELSLKDTALEFEILGLPLPETIKILLAKEQPEPDDPSGGAYRIISDTEMEARVAERKRLIEEQIKGLPERQKEVRELREQVKDKFGPAHGAEK